MTRSVGRRTVELRAQFVAITALVADPEHLSPTRPDPSRLVETSEWVLGVRRDRGWQ
ncbi:hypothetical protein NYO98_18675 [Nocardioides sp. STR2]|uniref:Uncharacterized protein n=1 Tax=Nocardioides pini TaxID=2975053 RepID=A0ABT4CH75_9ACTN|nr:hypothetical protein [Nocardioides pini]